MAGITRHRDDREKKINESTRIVPDGEFWATSRRVRVIVRMSQGDPYLGSLSKAVVWFTVSRSRGHRDIMPYSVISNPGYLRGRNIMSRCLSWNVLAPTTPHRHNVLCPTRGALSGVGNAGMRSFPGVVTRVLRENALRDRTCPSTFRCLKSTSTNHVAPAGTGQRQLAPAAVQGLLRRAEAIRRGRADGNHGSDVLRRCWGLCAAAATAAALKADDDNKVNPRLYLPHSCLYTFRLLKDSNYPYSV